VIKRCFDFCTAAAGLIVASPALLVIAGLVLFSMGPPVIFRQRRVGKNGKEFTLLKFRTMTISPDAEKGEFEPGNLSRIMPLGRFLRKRNIDELPQLFNVMRGEMSLVGPRPEVKKWVEAYPERWAVVHRVKPGVTDPASLIYRHEETILAESRDPEKTYREEILPHKLALYEEYIGKENFFVDMAIIMKTIIAVLKS